ncbi:MAG: hypothetical protein AAF927_28085 [Bacteroidota bacterium]
MTRYISLSLLWVAFACQEPVIEVLDDNFQCSSETALQYYSINELTKVMDDYIIEALGHGGRPNAEGAMGRNVAGYFHVRFQMGLAPFADYVMDVEDTALLDQLMTAIEYSFAHQLPAGNFELLIPDDLQDLPAPTEGDMASGVAFFSSALGSALLSMQESDWFQADETAKARLDKLKPAIQALLDYLKQQEAVLFAYDAEAPNRLLFDAMAFYSLGRYLDDEPARKMGLEYAKAALAERHPQGYFLEKGGWDTSYQGVGLENGFRLLAFLLPDEPFREELFASLSCATNWQASRILSMGEISLAGNQRVFPGGEAFLGNEKQIAYKSTVVAFFYLHHFTGDDAYRRFAERIIEFYE